MLTLNLPQTDLRLEKRGDTMYVFDILRRRYIKVTPEEWVRQHFVHYLIEHLGYPTALMANETRLSIGGKQLRADTVVYDHSLHPRVIIEYKAPTVRLSQKVFDQISTYNMLMHVDYLMVSNGLQHYCCKMDYENQKYLFIENIPCYNNL